MVKFPMGSEGKQMQEQQMQAMRRESEGVVLTPPQQPAAGSRGPNTCCFCWCCCCSCSCLTVRNEEMGQGGQREPRNLKKEGTGNCEDSPKPTLEEARSWGQSFDKLMSCPAGRNAFRGFLRTEFSEENMLFWLACEDLKKETKSNVIEEKVRTIYEDYISILSPKEVSLDSRARDVIKKNMLEPSSCAFDDAQLQIYTLMQRDSYPRYLNSPAYTGLLRDLEESATKS